MSILQLYSSLKLSSERNSARKNLDLCVCFWWHCRLHLRELDRRYKFWGTIGYGESYWEDLFYHSKVFRLHALQHDAAIKYL